MKKKLLLYFGIILITVIGLRACYMKDYYHELKYPNKSDRVVLHKDSITIIPYCFVEDNNSLGVAFNFENIYDTVVIEKLDVHIISKDLPDQKNYLEEVSAIIQPAEPDGSGEHQYISAKTFEQIPVQEKTIVHSGSAFNGIRFFFKARRLTDTRFYNFIISGELMYKGERLVFKKEIQTRRVLVYRPYQMMT